MSSISEDEDYEYESDNEYLYNENDQSPVTKAMDSNTSHTSDSKPSQPQKFSLMDHEQVRTMNGDSFIVVNTTKLLPSLQALLSDVALLLNVDEDTARCLLINHLWNKEKLIESFYNSPETCLEEAGISLTDKLDENFNGILCMICYTKIETASEVTSLNCNHKFCSACFAQYLKVQVEEGPGCIRTRCPQHKCSRSVPYSLFERLLEPSHFEKYKGYNIRNFIDMSKGLRWCPAAGCDLIAVASSCTRSVRCTCDFAFCFGCGEEAHQPASCKQLVLWGEKCANESETANWILLNTKKCPNCSSRIEKNQGCNHMNCKVRVSFFILILVTLDQICKHEFCWICMGPWADHGTSTGGYYKCNRYQAAPQGDQSSMAKAKAELERYLHYYQRYHNHDQSAKYAVRQKEVAEKKLLEQAELEHLVQAILQVIDCRRVLKYTYVMGYFLSDESKLRGLFEHHQEMLEKNTEK